MTLDHVRKTYEAFGDEDPFFAVLSDKKKRGGGWDPGEFFATGVQEIADVFAYLDEVGVSVPRARALDFGCGAGRLSQALAGHFDEVVGVDISSSMVRTAQDHNKVGERVRYLVNTVGDLSQLESGSFDFVYSNITLQHMPTEAARGFIREFLRLLRPGGVAVFQVPDGRAFDPDSLGERLVEFWRGPVRRLSKRIRGKAPVEIHYVARPHVETIVREGGATLVDACDLTHGRKRWTSFRYCARKDASGG
jgi:2-polyprenyl-3-methyl-5-hydroxy-6-metoxy-1,4-benzoquinol methylase